MVWSLVAVRGAKGVGTGMELAPRPPCLPLLTARAVLEQRLPWAACARALPALWGLPDPRAPPRSGLGERVLRPGSHPCKPCAPRPSRPPRHCLPTPWWRMGCSCLPQVLVAWTLLGMAEGLTRAPWLPGPCRVCHPRLPWPPCSAGSARAAVSAACVATRWWPAPLWARRTWSRGGAWGSTAWRRRWQSGVPALATPSPPFRSRVVVLGATPIAVVVLPVLRETVFPLVEWGPWLGLGPCE